MAKALTLHRTLVPPQDRDKFLARLQAKHVHYTAAGCRFWVFEEAAIPGAFVEFAEADSADVLKKAHASAPEQILDPTRIYTLVELS
jgi:hypothetical protein